MEEKKDVLILGIESSCDETAASVVKNGRTVLSNVISSQIELHKLYGGVVPEIASRKHIEKSIEAFEKYLNKYDDSAKLYIMGDGDEKENLRKLAKDLGADKNIIFTGKLGHNKLIEILKKSIAMLVYTEKDNNMVSIVESIALATPVITTDIPYNASYIKAEKLGIVNNNWNDDDLRKLATSDEYINNCMNYRKYLPTEYKAEQFLKVKGLI